MLNLFTMNFILEYPWFVDLSCGLGTTVDHTVGVGVYPSQIEEAERDGGSEKWDTTCTAYENQVSKFRWPAGAQRKC